MTARIYHIPSRREAETPWTSPESYEPEPRPSLLDRIATAFVDCIRFVFDNALAIGLGVVVGMLSVLIPAITIAEFVR